MTTKSAELPVVSTSHVNVLSGINHALHYLDNLLAKPRFPIPKGETAAYVQMRRDFPYVIHSTNDPSVQILLNRNYKPLGNSSRTGDDWVDYEACTNMHVQFSSNKIASVRAFNGHQYLFDDSAPPWSGKRHAEAYRMRLLELRGLVAAGKCA